MKRATYYRIPSPTLRRWITNPGEGTLAGLYFVFQNSDKEPLDSVHVQRVLMTRGTDSSGGADPTNLDPTGDPWSIDDETEVTAEFIDEELLDSETLLDMELLKDDPEKPSYYQLEGFRRYGRRVEFVYIPLSVLEFLSGNHPTVLLSGCVVTFGALHSRRRRGANRYFSLKLEGAGNNDAFPPADIRYGVFSGTTCPPVWWPD